VRKAARPLSALQQKFARQLGGGTFRQLNEQLYTSTGAQAAALMRREPHLFAAYHAGYADQVRRWPANPLDCVLAFLRTQPVGVVVADLGCGAARLAAETPQSVVHSFDLVAANERVVACDIARTPLGDSAVDVAVFCLSLMGTNYGEFLVEARRIVRPGGYVLVAEVASRFEGQDPAAFKRAVAGLGFVAEEQHPFVIGGAEVRVSSGGGWPRQKGGGGKTVVGVMKKGGRKRGQRAGVNGSPFDSAPGSAAMSRAAFFLHFAFRSTKNKPGAQTKPSKSMPLLKTCVYKKR
jgi:ribosomal RNA-processing protein 8